jgi:hypothetical protein
MKPNDLLRDLNADTRGREERGISALHEAVQTTTGFATGLEIEMTHRELIEQMLDALLDDAIESRNPEQQSAITAAKEYLAAPEQLKPTKNHEWMLTNAFYRMYNHGKNDNPVSAQCEVQALGMFLRGDEMSAWKTSVVAPQPSISELPDAERLDFLEHKLFGKKWNGVIDSGSKTYWQIWSGYQHITQVMVGHTFRQAIDAARAAL